MVVVDTSNDEIALGLDIGGIHSAEALVLARYFMYTQVYFHDVRRAYDLHLKDFLQAWLPDGKFPCDWNEMLRYTDHEVLVDLRKASASADHQHHTLAGRMMSRRHFRTIYELLSPRGLSPRGQTEFQVNLKLGLTRMAVPEALTRFPQSILGLLPGLV